MNKFTDAKRSVTKKVDEIKQTDISIGTKFEISVSQFGMTVIKTIGIVSVLILIFKMLSKLRK